MFEKTKKVALAIAIVIVLNIFFNYGIFTFYNSPEFEDFCQISTKVAEPIGSAEECGNLGGEWSSNLGERPIPVPLEGPTIKGYCDLQFYCRQDYQDARDSYNRNVFIILLTLGIITLVLGFYAIKVEAVTNGFLFGGILSIIIGTMRYWSSAPDYLRFILSGVALVLLIFIGYKKFKNGI